MEYDKMGRVWRVTNDQWVEDWRYFETDKTDGGYTLGKLQYWGVLEVDQAMSWDNAQSYVDTTYNANYFWYGLAKVRNELELQWFADTFSPEDGSEVKYWIDGYQDGDPGDPYCLPGTWGCWRWEAQMGIFYDDPEETYVPWIPVGETPPWPDFNISGGWLAGEPDDVDGVENGQKNRMLLVLNRGGVAGDYGFEDADGSEQHPFLVMAGTSAKDFYPADTLGGYQENWSRRFSYLGDRQRIADVEIGGLDENHKFTDYVGNAPVLDYWDPSDNATPLTAYVPGLAEIDLFDEVNEVPWATPVVTYLYTDMLGSTWFKTSDPASGTVTATLSTVRTAFGEIIAVGGTGPDSRYGYVGAHGYQEHDYDSGDGGTTYRGDGIPDNLIGRSATDGFPYMHVGARYYNPSTGRFMQRDPIGIWGGLNTYVYVLNMPTVGIDPTGHGFWDGNSWGFHDWVARKIWMRIHTTKTLAEMSDGRAYAESIGGSVGIVYIGRFLIKKFSPGIAWFGYGNGSFGFRAAGDVAWRVGDLAWKSKIFRMSLWRMRGIPLPVLFLSRLQNAGDTSYLCCFFTMVRNFGRGWGLP